MCTYIIGILCVYYSTRVTYITMSYYVHYTLHRPVVYNTYYKYIPIRVFKYIICVAGRLMGNNNIVTS